MSNRQTLLTPILLKTDDDMKLPEEIGAYLLLAGNGLWMCRNHEFFTSCVPARGWPSELADHESSLTLHHPRIPRRMMERVVGFFDAVALTHESEAGVLLIWNHKLHQMEIVVPPQVGTISIGRHGTVYPVGLHYDTPTNLGPERRIIGDIHSHVYDAAYSSGQDKYDEQYRPGLHLVIGRLNQEPPEFHAEYVVDGTRFKVDADTILAGYRQRRSDVPRGWLRRVRIEPCGSNRVYPFGADVIAEENRPWSSNGRSSASGQTIAQDAYDDDFLITSVEEHREGDQEGDGSDQAPRPESSESPDPGDREAGDAPPSSSDPPELQQDKRPGEPPR